MIKLHSIIFTLRAFLLLWLIIPMKANAEETWCAVTDNNHIVALSNINYLASVAGAAKFHVVLNDGSAITDVESLTFSKFHVDGVTDIDLDRASELKIADDIIVISNARIGSTLSIATVNGRIILSTAIVSDRQEVDISGLDPNVYILIVDGKPMKFQKL